MMVAVDSGEEGYQIRRNRQDDSVFITSLFSQLLYFAIIPTLPMALLHQPALPATIHVHVPPEPFPDLLVILVPQHMRQFHPRPDRQILHLVWRVLGRPHIPLPQPLGQVTQRHRIVKRILHYSHRWM